MHELPSELLQSLLNHFLGDVVIRGSFEDLSHSVVGIGICAKENNCLIDLCTQQEVLERLGSLPNSCDQDSCCKRIKGSAMANLDLNPFVLPPLALIMRLAISSSSLGF